VAIYARFSSDLQRAASVDDDDIGPKIELIGDLLMPCAKQA
jgi:hypothetical protein